MFGNIDSGASNRSTMFVTALTKLGHVDVISFVEGDVSNVPNCEVIYCKSVPSVRKPGRWSKFMAILAPLQYPLNATKEHIIDGYMAAKKYDFIAIRYVNEVVECGLLKYANRLLLDVDDDPVLAIMQQAKFARTLRNKIYTYIQAIETGWIVKHILKKVYQCYHSNVLQAPSRKSVYLHNVAMNSEALPDITNETPMRLLMVGTYHYAPNREGMNHFLKNIFPIICKAIPEIELRVVGRIYDVKLKDEWGKIPNVTLVGYVDDLRMEYENVRVALIPLYSGTGTSIKFIEAVGLNRVCVTTPQGVRGIDMYLQADEDYLLANSDAEFARKIIDTICDVKKCNKIAQSAKIKLDRSLSKEKFIKIIQQSVIG